MNPGLWDLYLAVNLLKHGHRRHGCDLLERRPRWFRRRPTLVPALNGTTRYAFPMQMWTSCSASSPPQALSLVISAKVFGLESTLRL